MRDHGESMSSSESEPKWRAWLHRVPPLAYWLAAGVSLTVGVTLPAAIWHTWNASAVGAIVAGAFIGLPAFLDAVGKRRTAAEVGSTKAGLVSPSSGSTGARSELSLPVTAAIDLAQPSTQLKDQPTTAGADDMGWDIELNPVVAALANAIPDHRAIRTITVQAGLNPATIDPEGAPDVRWQVVMEHAWEKGDAVVDRILALALVRSSNRLLYDAVAAYRTHRANQG
jgi:hypothetical protein